MPSAWFSVSSAAFAHCAGDDGLVAPTISCAASDRVLEIFTPTTGKLLRAADPFGRLGGEEFAVLMHDASIEQAMATAERIGQAFAQHSRNQWSRIGACMRSRSPLLTPLNATAAIQSPRPCC
jgi:diguanylate cyclase (GGDEF)-like protein